MKTKWRFGLSNCFDGRLDRDSLAAFRDAGVECIELSVYDHADFIARSEEICALVRSYGIEPRSVHLPFGPTINIGTIDAERRAFSMALDRDVLTAAGKAGIGVAVIHGSTEPNLDRDRPTLFENTVNDLTELCDYCAPLGITLAVEDLPRTCLGNCLGEMNALLSRVPSLRSCFDTNHILKQDNVEYIREVNADGSKIITLHVSDYDFVDEKHWLPFRGKNNWKGIIDALDETGYTGPWLYEVPSGGKLTPRDMRENYEALMALRG